MNTSGKKRLLRRFITGHLTLADMKPDQRKYLYRKGVISMDGNTINMVQAAHLFRQMGGKFEGEASNDLS